MSVVIVVTNGVWTSDEIELCATLERRLLAFADATGRSVESIVEHALFEELARHTEGVPMSPIYLERDVTDAYLQGLVAAYRAGYTAAGGVNDDEHTGDTQPIIDALEAHAIRTDTGARELGASKAKAEGGSAQS